MTIGMVGSAVVGIIILIFCYLVLFEEGEDDKKLTYDVNMDPDISFDSLDDLDGYVVSDISVAGEDTLLDTAED